MRTSLRGEIMAHRVDNPFHGYLASTPRRRFGLPSNQKGHVQLLGANLGHLK